VQFYDRIRPCRCRRYGRLDRRLVSSLGVYRIVNRRSTARMARYELDQETKAILATWCRYLLAFFAAGLIVFLMG